MDLGNKTLNNLISKNQTEALEAAALIIGACDIQSFKLLVSKSEFLFDFIKEKISKNLYSVINEDNIINIFDFLKVWSDDYKDFIVNALFTYQNKEITGRLIYLLKNGTREERAYAIEFFTKTKEKGVVPHAQKYINSSFYPLKAASIKCLCAFDEKAEFNKKIKILSSKADNFTKMEAVEFLTLYGDKAAFEPVFEYFLSDPLNGTIASNLLLLKNFEELISENKDDVVLKIYSAILYNFPEEISFGEISSYLSDTMFDFLVETPVEAAILLNLYLKNKLNLIFENEEYSIDLTNNDKKEVQNLLKKLELLLFGVDIDDCLKAALTNENKAYNLIALELVREYENAPLKILGLVNVLAFEANDVETIMSALNTLKPRNALNKELLDKLKSKIKNETIRAEIDNFYGSIPR